MTTPRRWSFSLRMLFVLVTMAGVASWLGWQANIVRQRARFYASIAAENGFALTVEGGVELPIIRKVLGDKPRHFLALPVGTLPERERQAKLLFPEATVCVNHIVD